MIRNPAPDSAHASEAAAIPATSGDYGRDREAFGAFWSKGSRRLDALPPKAKRSAVEQQQAAAILQAGREARKAFLRTHVATLYERLTANLARSSRVEDLAYAAAAEVPGLCPSREVVAREAVLVQKHKDGHEVDQGLLFNY